MTLHRNVPCHLQIQWLQTLDPLCIGGPHLKVSFNPSFRLIWHEQYVFHQHHEYDVLINHYNLPACLWIIEIINYFIKVAFIQIYI